MVSSQGGPEIPCKCSFTDSSDDLLEKKQATLLGML